MKRWKHSLTEQIYSKAKQDLLGLPALCANGVIDGPGGFGILFEDDSGFGRYRYDWSSEGGPAAHQFDQVWMRLVPLVQEGLRTHEAPDGVVAAGNMAWMGNKS